VKTLAVDFVVSHVSDIREAVRFYRETLGVDQPFVHEEGWIVGDGQTDTWTEFDTNPVALAISKWPAEAGRAGIALAVEDVHGAVDELRTKGVEIVMEPADGDGCCMAWIRDPWGNLICIHHRKDGTLG